MVEFALVLPILLTLVLGITDFGRAFNYWIDQTHMANTAARLAVTNRYPGCANVPSPCTAPSLQCYIKRLGDTSQLRNDADTSSNCANTAGAFVCMEFPTGNTLVGDPVRARVGFAFNWLPWFSAGWLARGGPVLGSVKIEGTATMRLEALPTTYSPTNNPPECNT